MNFRYENDVAVEVVCPTGTNIALLPCEDRKIVDGQYIACTHPSLKTVFIPAEYCRGCPHRLKPQADKRKPIPEHYFNERPPVSELWKTVKIEGGPITMPAAVGPGTNLKAKFDAVKINHSGCGGCSALLSDMNKWGAEECLTRKPEIMRRLSENKRTAGVNWLDLAKGAGFALAKGMLSALTPQKVLENWVDESIAAAAVEEKNREAINP